MLGRAEISAAGMARFFDLLADQQGGIGLPAFLATHPDTGGRADRAREAAATQGATTPALTPAQWRALQEICG
jgi:predicted Zn-dependent protease